MVEQYVVMLLTNTRPVVLNLFAVLERCKFLINSDDPKHLGRETLL